MSYLQRAKSDETAVYHCISRVVHQRRLLDEEALGVFRRMLDKQAAFCGVEVLTFCFLSNHFHLLVRVDPRAPLALDDAELVRRFAGLYGGDRAQSMGLNAEELARLMEGGPPEAAEGARAQLRARMGNVSVFMKELKSRFTIWHNKTRGTGGTFWSEKFRSVLVEETSTALRLVALYIDLNALRAGLASHPAAYRFSGFGEACAGREGALKGIARIMREADAPKALEAYGRMVEGLVAASKRDCRPPGGTAPSAGRGRSAPEAAAMERLLLQKTPAFSRGRALGSPAFASRFARASVRGDPTPAPLSGDCPEAGGGVLAVAMRWIRHPAERLPEPKTTGSA